MKATEKQKEKMRERYQNMKEILKPIKQGYYQKHKIRIKKYYREHKEHYQALGRKYNKNIRLEVLAHYGSKCECCGENRYEFLCFDHIEGGGIKHRKQLGWNGSSIAKWLKRSNYPKGFRVLCHNCNLALGFYGKCPHKLEPKYSAENSI